MKSTASLIPPPVIPIAPHSSPSTTYTLGPSHNPPPHPPTENDGNHIYVHMSRVNIYNNPECRQWSYCAKHSYFGKFLEIAFVISLHLLMCLFRGFTVDVVSIQSLFTLWFLFTETINSQPLFSLRVIYAVDIAISGFWLGLRYLDRIT